MREVFFVFNVKTNSFIAENNSITKDHHKIKYVTEAEAVDLAYDLGSEWGVGSCLVD